MPRREDAPERPAGPPRPERPAGQPARRELRGPKPRPASPKGPRQASPKEPPRDIELFAVAAPGLEEVLRAEAAALPGVTGVSAEPGGVRLRGPRALVGEANLWLRSATRVLLRLGRFRATKFPQVVDAITAIPWERYLRGAAVMARVTCHRSRLYHSGAVAERLRLGIAARLGVSPAPADVGALEPDGGEGSGPLVLLRGVDDEWELSLDTSGALLHQRGYRTEAGAAPLRETLAAGLLLRAGYAGGPLVDLCCGSGTFAIEAALLQRSMAPGLGRGFAFAAWPDHDEAAWQRQRAAAAAKALPEPPEAERPIAIDQDPSVLALAQRNAARAGVVARFLCADLFTLWPGHGLPDERDPAWSWPDVLLCANPPYGERLRPGGAPLYRRLGQHLRQRFPKSRALLLCGPKTNAEALRLPLGIVRVQNGGLPLTVLCGRLDASHAAAPSAH